MELCIAIEVALGVSLAPEELERYPTLGALVRTSRSGCVVDAYLDKLAPAQPQPVQSPAHRAREPSRARGDLRADRRRARTCHRGAAASVYWLGQMDTLLRGGGRRVQGYVRHALAEGAPATRRPATIAARWADARPRLHRDAGRLMMPISLFLQHCPADRYEFVLLTDQTRASS
jgi:hypothetical protein